MTDISFKFVQTERLKQVKAEQTVKLKALYKEIYATELTWLRKLRQDV